MAQAVKQQNGPVRQRTGLFVCIEDVNRPRLFSSFDVQAQDDKGRTDEAGDRKMKKFFLFAVIGMLTAAAVAQTPRTPPTPAQIAQRQVEHLTRVLSLTGAQQAQALTIFTNAATAGSALHDSMKSAHDALSAAITANNAGGIDQAAATIGNLSAQETSIRGRADAAFYQILTADQQAEYSKMMAHGRGGPGMGPHMRFGGHGGPPQQ
jgi:Spy/CpxP family protein refolding chaperone